MRKLWFNKIGSWQKLVTYKCVMSSWLRSTLLFKAVRSSKSFKESFGGFGFGFAKSFGGPKTW